MNFTQKSGKITKLLFVTVIALLAISFAGVSNVSAAKTDSSEQKPVQLTPEQIKEINSKLETLKEKANKQLENGKEEIHLTANLSFSEEPLEFHLNSNNEESKQVINSAVQEETFSATVENKTYVGAGFSHNVDGSFTYENGDVKGYTYDVDLSGPAWGKSDDSSAQRLDPSVVKLSSNGTFSLLKYIPTEYTTSIVIGMYGSGDYRILEASLN